MSELVEFIRGCLDADEQTDMGMPHYDRCRQFGGWPGEPDTYEPCTCGVSARVLAEVNAKRAILDLAEDAFAHTSTDLPKDYMRATLRLLAQPFAGEPGWRDEWGTQ